MTVLLEEETARSAERELAKDPSWVRPAVATLLVATAVPYVRGLSASGTANDFYAAAVQAGTTSWKAFSCGSSAASNFITVDKPSGIAVVQAHFATGDGRRSNRLRPVEGHRADGSDVPNTRRAHVAVRCRSCRSVLGA